MNASTQVAEVPSTLEERLDLHAHILVNKLSGEASTEEIEAEVTTLHELVNELKRRDELLEKLLDPTTPTAEVREIFEQSSEPAIRVADNRNELDRLHSQSHQLIEHSVLLITKGQRLVDQVKNRTSRYALEVCGFCGGFGGTKNRTCPACNGKRSVLVYQPALECPRCEGKGKQDGSDPSVKCYEICTVCGGSGWAFRIARRHEREE